MLVGLAVGAGLSAVMLRHPAPAAKVRGAPKVSAQRRFVGVDLGGTTVAVGVVDDAGAVVCHLSEPLRADRSFAAVSAHIVELVHRAVAEAGLAMSAITAVGVGAPGSLDFDSGVVRSAAAFDWKDAPLAAAVEHGTGCPTVLENDANAALLAEWWAGAGAGDDVRHIVMLTLGTGVGGAIVADNRLLRGATGMAGELGHAIVEPRVGMSEKGRLCKGTGVHGVFEQYTSANAVADRAVDLLQAEPSTPSSLRAATSVGGGGRPSAKEVFEHAAAGDALAARIVDSTAEYLAVGCINICRAFDPQVIVVTGGLALAGEQLLGPVRKWFDKHHWTIQPPTVRIVPAETGNAAGMIGAAAAARINCDSA